MTNIPKIFKDSDVSTRLISSRKVGIVGFGNQGQAQAMNLKDSGIDVCIGLREDSKQRKIVHEKGLSYNLISFPPGNIHCSSTLLNILFIVNIFL